MRNLIIVITFIWVGLVFGISFIEAPLKFTAPNITLALGLGIGRVVFGALNKIEIVFSIIILISFWIGKFSFKEYYLYLVAFFILLVQTVWLIPILDERAELIIAGEELEKTNHHIFYIIIEVLKIVSLLIGGIFFLKRQFMLTKN